MVNGYTFGKQSISSIGTRWRCTKRVCKAYLHLDRFYAIKKANLTHTHEPSVYKQVEGIYFKHHIKWRCYDEN